MLLNIGNQGTKSGISSVSKTRGVLADYEQSVVGKDFVVERVGGNGQVMIDFSIDPLAQSTESSITHVAALSAPLNMSAVASISLRTRHSHFHLHVVDGIGDGDVPVAVNIASISQTGNTLTIVLATAFDGVRGDWISVSGLADTRYNYANAAILTISNDKLTLTITNSDESSLPSLTLAAILNTGSILRHRRAIMSKNGSGYRFMAGNNSVGAGMISRGSKGLVRKSSQFGSFEAVSTGSTTTIYNGAGNGQTELRANTCFELNHSRDQVAFLDYGVDQFNSPATARQIFEGALPDYSALYKARIRATTPIGTSRPVAKIVSAVKATASTTATITTDVPHGLQAGAIIEIQGIRDQVNFVSSSGMTVVSVTATSFTVAIGTAVIATSYGGSVIVRSGSLSMVGFATQAIQSISVTNGVLTVIGSAAWGTIQVGEYVNVHGVRDNVTGADLGVDGVYMLFDVSTTTATLHIVRNLDGTPAKSGDGLNISPTLANMASTNCGGTLILRSTMHVFDLQLRQYNYQVTKIDGQGEQRPDKALPVNITGSVTLPVTTLAGAATITAITTAATTNATSARTTAANMTTLLVTNPSAATIFLKFYNKTSAPVVGTDIPLFTIPIAATSFLSHNFGMMGTRFSLGLAFAATGLIADTDTTAIAADCKIVLNYS